jgi:hypothetical protein
MDLETENKRLLDWNRRANAGGQTVQPRPLLVACMDGRVANA